MRRGFVIAAALTLTAFLGIPPAEAQKGPLKVGLLLPVTGVQAANGKDIWSTAFNSFWMSKVESWQVGK